MDFRTADLGGATVREELQLDGLLLSEALSLLQAYQRILRILPPGEDHYAPPLIAGGLHSAIQIAGVPSAQVPRALERALPWRRSARRDRGL